MEHCNENCTCECHRCDCCIRFRETWTAGSIYRPCDAVPYNGSSYAAIHWNQNDPPPSSNWSLLAAKGDPGPEGPAGPQGPPGPAGQSAFPQVFTKAYVNGEVEFGTGGSPFAALPLPAGDYVLWATVPIALRDTDPQNWNILLTANNGATVSGGVDGRMPPTDGAHHQPVSILAVCHAPKPTTITFTGFGYNVFLSTPYPDKYMITAIQTRSL